MCLRNLLGLRRRLVPLCRCSFASAGAEAGSRRKRDGHAADCPCRRSARALARLVRRPRLAAATAPDGDARRGGGRPGRAARGTHRRRQDVGRLPAVAGGPGGERSGEGTAHALRLAPEGADDRCRPQPRGADPANGARRHDRDQDRRHPREPADEAAPEPARHPAHDARIARPAAVLPGCDRVLRAPPPRGAGRAARAGGEQARRPALVGLGPAARAGAGSAPRGPLGDRGEARPPAPLPLGPARDGGADPGRAGSGTRGRALGSRARDALGRACRPLRDERRLPADPGAPHHARVHQHAGAGGAGLRRALAAQPGRSADRAAPRQPRRRAAP